MTRNDGLWIFVATVFLNCNGLCVDLLLWHLEVSTVTDYSRRNVWAAGLIVAVNVAGLVGLCVHLFSRGNGR